MQRPQQPEEPPSRHNDVVIQQQDLPAARDRHSLVGRGRKPAIAVVDDQPHARQVGRRYSTVPSVEPLSTTISS